MQQVRFAENLRLAKLGDAAAQFSVALTLHDDSDACGIAMIQSTSDRWAIKAKKQGCKAAEGYCALYGLGEPTDCVRGLQLLELEGEAGHLGVQCLLGCFFHFGRRSVDIAVDFKKAAHWYQLAAAQGNPTAQCHLGVLYANGSGVLQDAREAVKLYRLAANQGYVDAQFNLALCFFKGVGVLQDYQEAVKWFRLAADQGNADAQYNLGVCHAKGHGVPRNIPEAEKWFVLAAEQEHLGALCAIAPYVQPNGRFKYADHFETS